MLSSTALTQVGAGLKLETQRQILVPSKTAAANQSAPINQAFSYSKRRSVSRGPSLVVDRLLARTAATWGITGPELERLSGAVRFMERHRPSSRFGLWLATTNRGACRSLIGDIWKRITRLQGSYRLLRYSVTTFESRGGLHAHITFIGTRDIANRLKASKQFGDLIDVRPVTDNNALAHKYLAKERTPQAGYRRGHMLGGRISGSHRLPGGGDRVRLSRELERDAIEAGYVEPWQHTYAKRSAEEKSYGPRPCRSRRERHLPTGGRS
jgi:hypothetical protein